MNKNVQNLSLEFLIHGMCKKSYSKYTYISSTVKKKKKKKDAERKLTDHRNLQKYEHVFIK